MYIDKEKRVWFSKEEMKVITGALHAFSYEMWKVKKENDFTSIKKKFLCSIADVQYVKDWFASLYRECKDSTHIFLLGDAMERLEIIRIVLEQCIKHFMKYEVADLGEITKKELEVVYRDFKVLSLQLEKIE